MEFIVKKSDICRELTSAATAIERKHSIPVLANFLLTAANGVLSIAGTDLDCSLRTTCPAAIAVEGSVTLPAQKLLAHIKLLPESDIHFTLMENNWVTIKAGRSRTKMIGMAATNFPALPKFPAESCVHIPIPILSILIEKTIFAVSVEESRYVLGGAQFELTKDSVAMVATDGHRLGFLSIAKPLEGFTVDTKLLFPKKALLNLKALIEPFEDGTVLFAYDDTTLFFKLDKQIMTSRKLTGQFPNYAAVLPKKEDSILSVELDSKILRDSLQRVSLFTDDRSNAVKLQFTKNNLRLSASNTEDGETEENIEIDFSAEPITAGFNGLYIRDILKSVPESDRIRISLKNKDSAAEFSPVTGFDLATNRQVVMPMRV
jgi:DNA polymerase-3 subunit beta